MKKLYEQHTFTYYVEDEGTEGWCNQVDRMKEKGFCVLSISDPYGMISMKTIVFEKVFG